MERTVLITGSNGFIGSHVAQELKGRYRLVGVDTDSVNFPGATDDYFQMTLPHPDLDQVMARYKPDAVVHMAGSANVALSMDHPGVDFQAGPVTVFQVLDAIRKADLTSTFIFPSSAAVYGNPDSLPVREDSRLGPISPYGFHKLICETVIREFQQIYGIPHVIMRIFSCYGAGLRKQLLWDVAGKIRSKRLELFGDGDETRDFIHVRDVSRLVAGLLDRDVKSMTLNVAQGRQVSIRTIVERMCSLLSSNGLKPSFTGNRRSGDPVHWEADVGQLRGLGFDPVVGLEEGLAAFCSWYQGLVP